MHSETVILFCQQIVTISQPEGAGPSPAPWLTGDRIGRSADLQIFGRFLATVRDDVETHLRAFRQAGVASLLDRGDMDEHVFAAGVRLDKPVTLGRVEPLHCPHRHVSFSDKNQASKILSERIGEGRKTSNSGSERL